MKEHVQQLFDLGADANRRYGEWLKHMLTLASTTLAVLVALRPQPPLDGPAKWLLAASWISLGAGILLGAAATYGEVSLARKLLHRFREQLLRNMRETGDPSALKPVVAQMGLVWRISRALMVLFLLLAVVCLVSFAVVDTLWRRPA